MLRFAVLWTLTGAVLFSACGSDLRAQRRPLEKGQQGWRSLAPLGAGPRQETAVVALGGLVYVLGGFIDNQTSVAWVEAYDPKVDSWAEATPLPRALHHANAAVVGDRLYVLGALVGNSFTAIGDGFVYNPGTNCWSRVASMPPGTERGASGTAAIGSKIFIAGGLRVGRSVSDFSVYDTQTDSWEPLPGFSEPRDHLIAAAVDGKFYAVGGRQSPGGSLRGNVDEFDPDTGVWTSKTPMLTARAGTAGAVVANRILVAGGEGNRDHPLGVFSQNEAYEPASDSWEALQPMITPRHGTGGAAIGNVFFVPGGAMLEGFGASATHEGYWSPSNP